MNSNLYFLVHESLMQDLRGMLALYRLSITQGVYGSLDKDDCDYIAVTLLHFEDRLKNLEVKCFKDVDSEKNKDKEVAA